jgi:putative ABC transport system substrate-binding protein
MKRREFIVGLGGAVTWPVVARAQQPMPVIGFLNLATAAGSTERVALFREGLRELGFVEGRNVTVEYRWAEGRYDRLSELTADLVRRRVAVIAATSTAAAQAAKAATTDIPVVFHIGADPIVIGLVASLNRPGGNMTGVYNLSEELGPKRLELLHQLAPAVTVIGHLFNPDNTFPIEQRSRGIRNAAGQLGLQVHDLKASSEKDLPVAFESLKRLQGGGLLIAGDLFFGGQSEQLAALALRHHIPAIGEYHQFATAGGLASYGVSFKVSYRQLGAYTGRILKGEKPIDLPVQQATKAELTINLKTAKTLGITIPLPLLGRADEVIE